MKRIPIEDCPPFQPSWGFRLQRWAFANDMPLALELVSSIFLIGACFLTVFFAVTPLIG